jgi:hypothetical protein
VEGSVVQGEGGEVGEGVVSKEGAVDSPGTTESEYPEVVGASEGEERRQLGVGQRALFQAKCMEDVGGRHVDGTSHTIPPRCLGEATSLDGLKVGRGNEKAKNVNEVYLGVVEDDGSE